MTEQEPVAWLYTGGGHRPEASVRRFNDETRRRFNRTETPLYAAPPTLAEQTAALVDAAAKEKILHDRFPYVDQQDVNRPVTVHWFDVLMAIDAALATIRKEPLDG